MRKALLDKLCCPIDKKDLSLQVFKENEDGSVQEGLLRCTACQRYYPIIYGLPILSPDEYREKSLEAPVLKKWGIAIEGQEEKKFFLEENTTKP